MRMKLSEHQIQTLTAQGEGVSLEFKTCRDQLNRDVYETVCAFLNRHGGTLLLGVNDAGKITGIVPEALDQIRKEHSKRHNITVDSLLLELEEARQAAFEGERPQVSAAVSATMGKAKLLGLDKQVIEHTGKGGKDLEVVITRRVIG